MKIDFFKTKKNFKKKEYQININVYWKIILYIIFVVILVSFVYGSYLFMEISKDQPISATNTNDKIEQNRKTRIENILNYFSDKEKKYQSISNSPVLVVDPSL